MLSVWVVITEGDNSPTDATAYPTDQAATEAAIDIAKSYFKAEDGDDEAEFYRLAETDPHAAYAYVSDHDLDSTHDFTLRVEVNEIEVPILDELINAARHVVSTGQEDIYVEDTPTDDCFQEHVWDSEDADARCENCGCDREGTSTFVLKSRAHQEGLDELSRVVDRISADTQAESEATAPNSDEWNKRIVVVMEGGLVEDAYSNFGPVQLLVLDSDSEGADSADLYAGKYVSEPGVGHLDDLDTNQQLAIAQYDEGLTDEDQDRYDRVDYHGKAAVRDRHNVRGESFGISMWESEAEADQACRDLNNEWRGDA
jgi:hypothetical protein